MDKQKIKVAIGMSGGVDSSVSALLLKEQALRLSRSGSLSYEVIGLFMKLWHDPTCDISRENACCDERALADAQKVASKIGIPLYVVDARKQFKESVTDYFINEYKNLRTPNPCVVCNKMIKFGWLLDFARKIDCEYLATGHYSRIVKSLEYGVQRKDSKRSTLNPKQSFRLLKGKDESRDQSYFLHQLDQAQLAKILFPVGGMVKSEVREIAKKAKLPVFEKIESREICFVPDDYRSFLRRYIGEEYFEPGKIVDQDGFTVGRHDGLINYTIGQRKGISQDLGLRTGDLGKKALYVLGFDKGKNQLIVGEEKDLNKKEFEVKDMHWVDPENESRIMNNELRDITVKIRYKAEEVSCKLYPSSQGEKSKSSHPVGPNNKLTILLEQPVRAIAPGQSAVFYQGDEVLGGGIIA